MPVYDLLCASILDFRPRLENHCSVIVAAVRNSPPAAQSWGAGGEWRHKGGIILSKKPPEWRLSPPQQRFASDSNFVAAKENGSACSGCSGKNYF